jgi:hypothetical protein
MPALPHHHIQRTGRGLFEVIRASEEDSPAHAHFRGRIAAIIWVTALIDVLATVAVYLVEHGDQHTQMPRLFDAWLFTTSQLLTGGAVDSAVTHGGKVLTVLFDVYALTAVAALAGSFGQFFHHLHFQHKEEAAAAAATIGGSPAGTPPA